MVTIDELKKTRLEKLEALKKRGVDPYPGKALRKQTIKEARSSRGEVSVAGRVVGLRGHGKIVFTDLTDETGKIQLVFKADSLDQKIYSFLEFIDIGDFLDVQGEVGKTQAGEVSVFAKNFQIITKALRPLPDQWSGFKDVEERYRQRYVDLLMNPDVREIFVKRANVIRFLQEYLYKEGFMEVETPVLQSIYGGAAAKPFTTHHNALDIDFYLRISDELYLKRLIIGGFEKVYEIGKDFRNEGVDRNHNPEFTMLEFYWAYADYEKLMEFTEGMFAALLTAVHGSLVLEYQGKQLDFTPPWPRVTYRQALLKHTGIDIDEADTAEKLKKFVKEEGIAFDEKRTVGYGALLDALYKQTTRAHLAGPLFLTERPTAFVSLAKRLSTDPRKTASFQLLVAGEELINAYNELNDPQDQADRWRASEKLGKKGQREHEAFDKDYIRALEYGMPPTAGWGLGIDRLVAILTNQRSIKDVILFSTLRPEK